MTIFDGAHAEILRLVSERRYEDACRNCEEHLRTWPPTERHQALHNLAYVWRMSGDLPAAVRTITEAILLSPKDASHRDARMCWALELKDCEIVIQDGAALLDIERARESVAFRNAALVRRAFAYLQLGRRDDALRDLAEVDGEGPFRIWGANWTRDQLVSKANKEPGE
jgi:tetratricopeptide (TPR) repeat protein